jgi:hypothetical protein
MIRSLGHRCTNLELVDGCRLLPGSRPSRARCRRGRGTLTMAGGAGLSRRRALETTRGQRRPGSNNGTSDARRRVAWRPRTGYLPSPYPWPFSKSWSISKRRGSWWQLNTSRWADQRWSGQLGRPSARTRSPQAACAPSHGSGAACPLSPWSSQMAHCGCSPDSKSATGAARISPYPAGSDGPIMAEPPRTRTRTAPDARRVGVVAQGSRATANARTPPERPRPT